MGQGMILGPDGMQPVTAQQESGKTGLTGSIYKLLEFTTNILELSYLSLVLS